MRAARHQLPPSARTRALRMLARRDYSRAELALRLAGRGVPQREIDGVLEELERLGYLSDARYAQGLVAQRAGRYGKRAIARDLRDRQIAPLAAKAALAALGGRDELADATALWSQRFGQRPVDERDKARQVRFLMARGFDLSIALRVVGRLESDREAEPD